MVPATSDSFKIKNKPLVISVFSIQYLTAKTILTQYWKIEDQFDILEMLGNNLTEKPKVEDQNGI